MDAQAQIRKLEEFIELEYKDKLIAQINKDNKFLIIDFRKLAKFDNVLAADLLEDPKEVIKATEIALEKFDLLGDVKNLKVRFTDLPNSQRIPIWEIRQQVKKFIKLEGYVIELSDIQLRPLSIKFECPICGTVFNKLSNSHFTKLKLPDKCKCGYKGNFIIVERDLTPSRKFYVEEDVMEIGKREIPRRKLCIIEDDLTLPEMDKELRVGKRIVINGYLETYEVDKQGLMDTYLIVNSIEFVERGWPLIKVSEEDILKFKKLSKSKELIPTLIQSIMPTIHKEDEVKHGLLLQLAGTEHVTDGSGFMESRGCIHIALVGPPGVAKSAMAKRMKKFWPIYRYVHAVTATGRGLIATVVYDKTLEKWVLMPGVIPTCHMGMAAVDEMNRMEKEEYGYFNNAMEDLEVFIAKAAQGKVSTDVAILATMNPTGRIFIRDVPIYQQIDLPADIIDRFDLIFPINARVNEEDHRKIFRINLAQRKERKHIQPILSEQTVIKYFAYARRIKSKIPAGLEKVIEDRLMKFMSPGTSSEKQISHRIFLVVLRLLEASARLHLRDKVNVDDINEVMDLLVYSYQQQGLLTQDKLLDFGRIEHVDMGEAKAMPSIRDILRKLSSEVGIDVPIGDIMKATKEAGIEDDKVEEVLEKMRMSGDIIEYRRGIYRVNL